MAVFSFNEGYALSYNYDMFGRFHSVTSSISSTTSAFTYSYLAGTDLLSGMTASSGFLWTRAYESARSLITSVENRHGETVISRYDYENDELGRRTARADSGTAFAAQPTYGDSATVEMPAYNAYSYNTRSEVTGATRRWGTPGTSGDLVLGQQYAYEFDGIGNRIAAAEGDTSRIAAYTANALNQYTQRTVPAEKDLIGTAPTNVAVTVNQNPVSRQNAYWHHSLEVTNAASAAYPDVTITAVYNPPGTNGPDVVTSQTGRVFVAQTPESFTYDDDGNLTQDGRFEYTWNGENRLIKAETRDDLPAAVPRVKVDYAYDHQSRRIASATAVWTNDAWQAVESRAFLYDGWNVIRETVAVGSGSPQSGITNLYTWGLDLSGSLQGAGGIGGLLAASMAGTTVLYCYDANGNVGQLVDAATPTNILAHYEYSPFGETIVSTGSLAEANPFRFSTKHWDDLTGLGYWGYRYYHPDMGRWISKDPIEDNIEMVGATHPYDLEVAVISKVVRGTADINLYAAFGNSPSLYFDPFGLTCKSIRFTQSVQWGGSVGIGRTSGTIDYRNEVKTCDKLCADCSAGQDISQKSTIRVTGTASFQLPIPLPPLTRIDFFFGVSGGGQHEIKTDTCTGNTTQTGCAFYTVRAGLQGCAGRRNLGGEICLRGEGDLTHRWCADGTNETCMGAKVMLRTCFFSRCYDIVFYESPRRCW